MRKFIKTIILIISIIIPITIIFNLYSINQLNMVDKNEQLIDSVRNEYSASTLPIRVLKNIASQEQTNDIDKEKKLFEAYITNKDVLVNHFNIIASNLKDVQKSYSKSNPILDSINFEHSNLSLEIQQCLEEINKLQFVISSKFGTTINRNPDDIAELETIQKRLDTSLNNLYKNYFLYSKNSIDLLFRKLNLIIIVLILLISLMTILGIRFVNYDLRYIIACFKQLESHDYSLNHLPSFKRIFREEKEIYQTVENIFLEQEYSTEFKEIVMGTYMMDELIDLLFKKVEKRLTVDRVGIAFVDYKKGMFVAEYGVMNYGNIKLGPGFDVPIHESSLSSILESKTGFISNDLEILFEKKPTSKALKTILDENIKSNIVVPLMMNNIVFGLVFFSSTKKNHFNEDDLRLVTKLLYEIEGFLNRSYLTKVVFSKITSTFSELVDKKDNETGGHITRMVQYSITVAEGLKTNPIKGYELDKRTILDIERNASVHDIGKVAVPDSILKKPGKLTNDEWEIMKTHAAIGGDIFKNLRESLNLFDYDFFKVAEHIARYHHEKWDGTGYPEGLKGEEIPLVARIVAIADVFDALTSNRVYKEAYSIDEALDIIKTSKGTHFDPIIVEVFLSVIEQIKTIYYKNID